MTENPEAHPDHYGGKDNPYETIKVMKARLTKEEYLGALKFNIYKYQDRHRDKAGIKDLQKQIVYTRFLDEFLKENPDMELGPVTAEPAKKRERRPNLILSLRDRLSDLIKREEETLAAVKGDQEAEPEHRGRIDAYENVQRIIEEMTT